MADAGHGDQFGIAVPRDHRLRRGLGKQVGQRAPHDQQRRGAAPDLGQQGVRARQRLATDDQGPVHVDEEATGGGQLRHGAVYRRA